MEKGLHDSYCQNCEYSRMVARKYQRLLAPENCDLHKDGLCPDLDRDFESNPFMFEGEDLVSRKALLEVAVPVPGVFCKMVSAWDIVHAPAVEAAPVIYSKWVRDGDFLVCLGCDSEINVKNSLGVENKKNFCPCCGARMVKDE